MNQEALVRAFFVIGTLQSSRRFVSSCNIYICVQVVTEYERAVVFKLGRLKKGGSLGPGLHFELPCIGCIRLHLFCL